jgi:FAD synthase
MKVFRGFHHPGVAPACALTIGNFDGVHRGHQAMLALLNNEAAHRGVPSCVMTFEPHPRDYFAGALKEARTGAGAHRHAARQAHRTRALRRATGGGAAI